MRTLPQSGWLVTRQLLLSSSLVSTSLTGASPTVARSSPGAGWYSVHSMSSRSRLKPSRLCMGSRSKASGSTSRTPTVAGCSAPRHTASLRSARRRACTAAASAKRVLLKLFRYSLSDLLSTRFSVSHGTVKCASATCGLPRRLSQDSSYAVHRSAPKNGASPARPISARLGARASGNSSDAS